MTALTELLQSYSGTRGAKSCSIGGEGGTCDSGQVKGQLPLESIFDILRNSERPPQEAIPLTGVPPACRRSGEETCHRALRCIHRLHMSRAHHSFSRFSCTDCTHETVCIIQPCLCVGGNHLSVLSCRSQVPNFSFSSVQGSPLRWIWPAAPFSCRSCQSMVHPTEPAVRQLWRCGPRVSWNFTKDLLSRRGTTMAHGSGRASQWNPL